MRFCTSERGALVRSLQSTVFKLRSMLIYAITFWISDLLFHTVSAALTRRWQEFTLQTCSQLSLPHVIPLLGGILYFQVPPLYTCKSKKSCDNRTLETFCLTSSAFLPVFTLSLCKNTTQKLATTSRSISHIVQGM